METSSAWALGTSQKPCSRPLFPKYHPLRMTKPSLLELPPGVHLVYLAEGGANIVYRFVAASVKSLTKDPNGPSPSLPIESLEQRTLPAFFRGKLLRLRKETAADLSYKEIVQNFNNIVRPLFEPEELVDQALIRLPDGLIQRCNEQLHIDELSGKRPKKRHGGYLCPDEPLGLLITDMTTADDDSATMAELKPKWLIQSPSAPGNAQRCRTCALREMKNHEARRTGQTEQRSFCPLDLVSDHPDNVLRATEFIKGCKDQARLAKILFRNPTLQKLQSEQRRRDEVGLLGPPALSRDMSLDMTLRDCTMFIKIPRDEISPAEIRLGDLDMKTAAGGKSKYWRDVETKLIDGGWYHGNSQVASNCALHRANSST